MNSIIRNKLSIIALLLISTQLSANPCALINNVSSGFELIASTNTLGSGLGASGLHAFDSNQNGLNEIIFGSGSGFGENTSFLVAEYNGISGEFDLLCQSERYDDGISIISPFSNDDIATGSLIVDGGGNIEVIDHGAGVKAWLIQTSVRDIQDINVGDIDNDGSSEIAVLSENAIAIYDANTYAYEQSLNYGGEAFALGHFTAKTKTQIAINNGYVLELNDKILSTTWDYSVIGFSNLHLETGDIDNDGFDEIVSADRWGAMRAFNADNRGILWEHNAEFDSVAVYDATGDGIPEVIYGEGQWGNVYALNGNNGTQLWSVDNPEHGTTDVFIGDVDGDASLELIWGAGHSTTGPDYLFIHDIDSDTRQWRSPEGSEGGITAVSFGRLNSDTIPDRIVASAKSQAGDGVLTAYDGATNDILWQTTPSTFDSLAWEGINDIAVGDINNDSVSEVLVATSWAYDGRVYVLDAASGEITDTVVLENSSTIYSVRIANIDNDADMEILAGSGLYVHVIDSLTLAWEKSFPRLGNNSGNLWALEVADIDQDDNQEVLVLPSRAYILDPDNNGLLATVADDISSLAVSTDVANGDPLVYVGDSQGVLSHLAADASLTPLNNRLCYGNLVALEPISPVKLAFVCNGALGIYHITVDSVTWITKEGFDVNLGFHGRLKVETVNGKIQILVGGSNGYLFEESVAGSLDNTLHIQVRGLLQGAYDADSVLMHRYLADGGVLPLVQPYSDLFAHPGNKVLSPPIMELNGDNAPTDWVLVELRAADNSANRVFSYAGIVQRDGDVADSQNNFTTLAIPNVAAGVYYVSLRHRNHLSVMTAEPITLSATPTLIDFSNPATKVFGNHVRTQVDSVSLMLSGDLNKDEKIIGAGPGNDGNDILSTVLIHPDNGAANTNFTLPGYYVSDLNMDGMTIYSGPNNDANLILNNVLLHPENVRFANNFVVQGSLP